VLVDNGAPLNDVNRYGNTPLDKAHRAQVCGGGLWGAGGRGLGRWRLL